LSAQEKERKRVSRELHDELGQSLLTLKLQLRALEKRLAPGQAGLKTDFGLVFRHINRVTEDVRRISRELSPSILEDLGLVAALKWMIKRIGKHHYIEISCDVDALEGWFDPEKELILFRIFQEALTNVAKHSRTRHARIAARRYRRTFILTVEDKGQGFDTEKVLGRRNADRGLGLTAMDERVRMLGGRLKLWSQKQRGAVVTVSVPISNPAPPDQRGHA
jgi:signal transduction histidine kinase